jgi:hypothetical protein
MQVEWYSANPCFHPIPPGYGLPWGTPAEEDIPQSLVLETEMSLARAQLKTQTPAFEREPPAPLPARRSTVSDDAVRLANGQSPTLATVADADPRQMAKPAPGAARATVSASPNRQAKAAGAENSSAERTILVGPGGPPSVLAGGAPSRSGLPPDWPDPSGLIPPPPSCGRPECHPSDEPVMRHTRTYSGTDPEFTAALRNYTSFRDDARFGGWGSYLQRSDDFIRFCCHKHIAEMLTARGGAGQTRVVLRWSEGRYIP